MTVLVDQYSFVATLKNMPNSIMSTIGILGVNTVQLTHALRQVTLYGFHHNVVVITHQAVGIATPVKTCTNLTQ
jgi:hypothetical protein